MDYEISFAQNFEDVYLAAFFPDVDRGFYVDVGASHPVALSVTKRFSLAGWTGINIEPIREHLNALQLDRPDDVNLPIGVSDHPGRLTFRQYAGDGLSTFSSEMMRRYSEDQSSRHTSEFEEYEVEVRTLSEVFAEYAPDTIHFMKVDVEGYEFEALSGNDWSRFRPHVLCIEANHIVRDWRPLLTENGYERAFFDGLNEYYVAAEQAHRAAKFQEAYVDLLVKGPVVHYFVHMQMHEHARTSTLLRQDLEHAKAELARLRAEARKARPTTRPAPKEVRLADYLAAVDRRTTARLENWQRKSQRARLQRIEADALRDTDVDPRAKMQALQAADEQIAVGGVGPSRASTLVTASYEASKRALQGLAGRVRHRGSA